LKKWQQSKSLTAKDAKVRKEKPLKSAPIWDKVGITSFKAFGILIEAQGEGYGAQGAPIAEIADIAGIARDRKTQNLTTDKHG
jgi:hypothetical protein